MQTWTGGCLCGAIRYEATPENPETWYCHCRMCQRSSGSVVATDAIIRKSEFKITRGEPKFFQSSSFAERGFCPDCGSPLIFRPVKEDWLSIQTGTLDDPSVAPPAGHYGIESRVPWHVIDESLPQMRCEDDEWFSERSGSD